MIFVGLVLLVLGGLLLMRHCPSDCLKNKMYICSQFVLFAFIEGLS